MARIGLSKPYAAVYAVSGGTGTDDKGVLHYRYLLAAYGLVAGLMHKILPRKKAYIYIFIQNLMYFIE